MENGYTLKVISTKRRKSVFLPISANQSWFDALIKNDIENAKSILSNVSKDDQQTLLNSYFDFEEMMHGESGKISAFFLPLHFAAACNAKNIVEMLLKEYRVDVLCIDLNNCNVLHACVIGAIYCPHLEAKICETVKWLLETISDDQVQKLFAQEHRNGYRPIEFASQQGCVQLMKTFLESKGYVKKTVGFGAFEKRYHDITDYETGSRSLMSPINTLAYIDERTLNKKDDSEVILSPLLLAWIDAKIKTNFPLILLWTLIRYGMLGTYFILDSDVAWLYESKNSTAEAEYLLCPQLGHINTFNSRNVRLCLILLVIAFFAMSIILDIMETLGNFLGKNCNLQRDMRGKKKQVTNTRFYSVNHFILSVIVTFNMSVYLSTYLGQFPQNFEQTVVLLRAMIPILIMWSFNYFLQMIPMTGPSFISIQAMQADILKFLIMFVIILVPFALAFQSYIMYNSITGCVDDFSSIFKTCYSLFLLMLNNYDLSSLQVQNILVLKLLHVAYVFMIGIMLLNFLIAIMANKANLIQNNQQLVYKLNQLAVVNKLERRLKLINPMCYRSLVRMGFHCEGEKVYLVSENFRLAKLLEEQLPST